MTDIIPIPLRRTNIQGIEIETVDARDIHAFLDVGKDYTNWIKDRIEQYGFEGGLDYVRVFAETGENPRGGRPKAEYHVTLSMAKELAMVERNEKGRIARKYFLACEQRLKEVSRQIAVEPVLTPEVIGGIVKGVITKALTTAVNDTLPKLVEAKLAEDPRVAVGEYEPALKVCIAQGVPTKGRRGFANRVSHRLRAYCSERGIACRRDIWRGVWVFPVTAVSEWLKAEGAVLIGDHCVRLSGQSVLQFPRKGRKP